MSELPPGDAPILTDTALEGRAVPVLPATTAPGDGLAPQHVLSATGGDGRFGDSPWRAAWRRLRRNKLALVGLGLAAVLSVLAVLAPVLPLPDPYAQVYEYTIQRPGFRGDLLVTRSSGGEAASVRLIPIQSFQVDGQTVRYVGFDGAPGEIALAELADGGESSWHRRPLYLLGTDKYGRDVLSRTVFGARVSLSVGVIAVAIALILGIALGALGGYFRGWVDEVVMWLVNVVGSFPSLLLVIAISVALGQGFWQVFIAVGLTFWVDIARIVRGQFLALREAEFVEATHALGMRAPRTIFRHLLPNALGPIIVMATADFANAIIAEAGLSFLGLGVQPPTPSWGSMIRDGYGYIVAGQGWWLALVPGLAIMLAVLAFNLLGDGLRDALDPKLGR